MQNTNSLETPNTNVGKYAMIGTAIITISFVILGGWSYFAKMDTGVPLPGQVVVQSSKKIIQHLEGGIVEEIFVKEGDFVKKGDTLIKFRDTRATSSLQSLEAKFYEAVALADRLRAENKEERYILFSKELDELSAEKKEQIKSSQIAIFNNRHSQFEKQKKITSKKTESLNEQIENVKEIIKSKQNLLVSYQSEAKEQQELYDERLIDKVKLREMKRKIESLESDMLSDKTDITRTKLQIAELETQLALSEEDFFRKVKVQLRDTIISIADMRAKMTEVKDVLSRTSIKAPVDGTVLDLEVHTIGAVISPAKPIMKIVPKDSKLIITASLSPQYRDYMKVGLKANMTFPAFQLKGRFINKIEGEVIFVAADSTTDKNGNSFYKIKLIVDEEGEQTLKDEDLVLMAGMPANVVVKIGKQTTFEYLMKPMAVMLDRAFLEE